MEILNLFSRYFGFFPYISLTLYIVEDSSILGTSKFLIFPHKPYMVLKKLAHSLHGTHMFTFIFCSFVTVPETKITPESLGLEYEFPFGNASWQVRTG